MPIASRYFLIAASVFTLNACSSITEGDQQHIKFTAKGAEDVRCIVTIGEDEYKYQVYPPQKIWINKSHDNMYLDCEAQGNRRVHKKVESVVAATTFGNVLNGGLGLLPDAELGAMFKYPERIEVDFTGVVPQEQPLPPYENADALSADTSDRVESYDHESPVLSGDRMEATKHRMAYIAAEQEEAEAQAREEERNARRDAVEGGFYGDKGKPAKAAPEASDDEEPVTNVQPSSGPLFPTTTSF